MFSRAAFVDQGERLLSALFGLVRGRPFDGHHRRRRSSARRLGLEPLEARRLLSTVSITAPDPLAAEYGRPAPDNGLFRISRDSESTDPVTVFISRSGTAKMKADYAALPSSVVIPASQTYVDVPVVVVNDLANESTETVILTLKASTGYTLDADLAKRTATVTIADARPVRFSDPDLAAAVRSTLGLSSTYPVLQSDMPRLTTLTADANRIDSLRGLEFATDLQTLNIVPGDFSLVQQRKTALDLSPIGKLTQLSSVSLEGLGLANRALSVLNKLPAIRSVDMRYNKITDPKGLASNRSLQDLFLYGNPLTNVGSLKGKFIKTDLLPEGLEKASTVAEVAKALHYLPLDIYQYVLNNFRYQIYPGMMKGAQATLDTRAGSTLELANLLVELLGASGVTARFVDGRIEADKQTVMNWLGVTDPEAAFKLLLGSPEKVLDANAAITGFRFGKYWVEVLVPKVAGVQQWVGFDPSWKFRDFQPGVHDILRLVPFDTAAENEYLSQVRKETAAEWYENRVAQYLAANMPGVSVADIPYDGLIRPQIIAAVPSSLPFTVVSVDKTFTEITPDQTHRVNLTLKQGTDVLLKYSLSVPDVSLKRIALSYPHTNSFNLIPELRIDGKVVARGTKRLSYGYDAELVIDHLGPGDDIVDYSNVASHWTGQYVAVGLNALQFSERFLAGLQTQVNKTVLAQINGQPYSKDDQIRDLLSLAIAEWFYEDTRNISIIAGLTGAQIRHTDGVGSGVAKAVHIVTFAKDLQNPVVPRRASFDIRAPKGGSFVPIDNDQTVSSQRNHLEGFNSSALEHLVWEELINCRSVSTVKSLQLARERNIPIFTISQRNSWQINSLNHPQYIKDDLRSSVSRGATVLIPRDPTPLDKWNGVGWKVQWPDGAVDWFISGGTSGGASGDEVLSAPDVPLGNAADNQCYEGDPVNIANGNVTRDETDILLPGIGIPLTFARHYDSQSNMNVFMGIGWVHTYSHFLSFDSYGKINWITDKGNRYTFTPTGGGNYASPNTLHGTFSAVSGGYRYRETEGTTYTFDSRGRCMQIQDRNGNGVALDYEGTLWKLLGVHELADPQRRLTFTFSKGVLTAVTDFTGRTWRYGYSGNLLTSVTGPSDAQTAQAVVRYSYYTDKALNGLLKQVTEPNGATTQFTYYPNRRAFQVTDAAGHATTFSYNLYREQTDFIDERGNTTTYAYNDSGNLIGLTHPDLSHESFTWQNGLKTSTTDALGKTETYTYDARGNVTQTVDRAGRITTFTYEPTFNQVTRIESPGGETTLFAYDARGNLTQVTDALGYVTTMAYDGRGLPTSLTEPRGNQTPTPGDFTTTYVYNAAGQVLSCSTDLPSTASFTYDARGNLLTSTDARGNVTTFAYDLLNRPTRVTDADGKTTTYKYDAIGNLTATTDPLARTTKFTYDILRHLTNTVNADGTFVTSLYDSAGNAIVQTDELGRPLVTMFGPRNRPIVTLFADGTMTQTRYDGDGRTTATVDPRGNVTSLAYDALDRLTKTTDALGNATTRAYDAAGNLASVTDPLGRTTQFRYDLLNRQTAVIDPLLNTTTTVYDADGNVVSITDPLNHTTQYAYDVSDRCTTVIDALNHVTTTAYDAAGNPIAVTDPSGNTTTYTYNRRNRVSAELAQGLAETFAYDAVGNLVALTDRNGRTRRFTYDARNRGTSEQWLDALGAPVRTIQYSYDAAGELTAVADPDSAYVYAYDNVGRVTSADNIGTPGVPDVLLTFGYDTAGNVVSVTDRINGAAGAVEVRTFDALNRITRITQSGDGVADKRIDLQYDTASEITRLSRFSDLAGSFTVAKTDFSYDAASRLTGLTHRVGMSFPWDEQVIAYQWTHDAAGRVTQETNPDGTTTYTYDATNQLTGAGHASQADESYSYDADGNRTNAGYQTAAGNRLSSDGTYNYTYDGQGNLVQRRGIAGGDVTEYSWDYRNRLTSVVTRDAAGHVTARADYTYDALDRRIAKSVDADGEGPQIPTVTRFVYNGNNIVLQFDDSGSVTHRYLYGPAVDQVLVDDQGGRNVFWLLGDNLGSIRDVVRSNGSAVDHITYDAFGRITSETNPAGAPLFAFAGRELDRETGLQFNRARYYDPSTGRFLSQDPLSFAAGDTNLYRYVGNGPTNATDPTGLQTWGGFFDSLGDLGTGSVESTQFPVMMCIPSPNSGKREAGQVTAIIVHGTEGSLESALEEFKKKGVKDPKTHKNTGKSSHLLVDKNGDVVAMVSPDRAAWHAGTSSLGGQKSVNDYSIGIEFVNWGKVTPLPGRSGYYKEIDHGEGKPKTYTYTGYDAVLINGEFYDPFTDAQYELGNRLASGLLNMYPIQNITGHSNVALPRGRKVDPGPAFDWERMKRALPGYGGQVGPLNR